MLRSWNTTIIRAMAVLCLALLALSTALAQTAGERVLSPGVPVEGVIDEANLAQVYAFSAAAGDTVTLTAQTTDGLALVLVVTDVLGVNVAQVADVEGLGEVQISDLVLSSGGIYYATVFVAAGIETATTGTFTITLEGDVAEAAAPTGVPAQSEEVTILQLGQVLTSSGIQVNLRWDTPDDLNLQVRDPSGESLFWDSRTTTTGGTFGFDVNGLCEVTSPAGNVETASWPGGPVFTGSYEILVYYRQPCLGLNAVAFSVDVTVNGVLLEAITGTLQPPATGGFNVYISSFKVNADGTAANGASGPYTDTRVLPAPITELQAAPAPVVALDSPVVGLITSERHYQVYRFDGVAGQIVSVSLTATTGSLDTLLLVLDSNGNIVDANDDVQSAVNTDSALNALRLPTTDTYLIVATRYGKEVGGTEGNYTLLVSAPVEAALPEDVINLQLPAGDIEITLVWNTGADLRLLVRDPSLNSVFNDRREVPTGGRLAATGNINCNLSPTTPVSYVYWPQGLLRIGSYEIDIWNRSECNDTRPAQFTLYVAVRGRLIMSESATIPFNQHYITSFVVEDTQGNATPGLFGPLGGSETINFFDQLASAVTIAPGQNVPGAITAANPFDVYVFEGRAGDVVTIDMRATSNLDPLLFLINPSGVEIAQNDDANEGTIDSLINQVLLSQDGQYTIIATRFGTVYGGTAGSYTLTLRID